MIINRYVGQGRKLTGFGQKMLIPTLTLKSKINKNAKIQDMETKNAPQIMSAKENLVNICLFLSYQFYCHKM